MLLVPPNERRRSDDQQFSVWPPVQLELAIGRLRQWQVLRLRCRTGQHGGDACDGGEGGRHAYGERG